MSESVDQMQARIQSARREAEGLKDKIKRKKDELADGSRKCSSPSTGVLCYRRRVVANLINP